MAPSPEMDMLSGARLNKDKSRNPGPCCLITPKHLPAPQRWARGHLDHLRNVMNDAETQSLQQAGVMKVSGGNFLGGGSSV